MAKLAVEFGLKNGAKKIKTSKLPFLVSPIPKQAPPLNSH